MWYPDNQLRKKTEFVYSTELSTTELATPMYKT